MIRNAAKTFLFVFTLMAFMTRTSFAFPPSDPSTAIPGNACKKMNISMSGVLDISLMWSEMLKAWSADWIGESQNLFCLTVFRGGSQSVGALLNSGEEEVIFGKLRGENPQLHLAIISTVGLVQFLDSEDRNDLHRINISGGLPTSNVNVLRANLEQKLLAKNIIVLSWNYMGKLRFFTKKQISNFDEFKTKNIWVGKYLSDAFRTAISSEGNRQNTTVSSTSYEITDVGGLLEQKKSDIFLRTILPDQREDISYMIDFDWATMTSATVVKSKQWNMLPLDLRNKLKTRLIDKANNISKSVQQMENLQVNQLQQNGKIIHIQNAGEWEKFRERVISAAKK